jgi:regulatory protein
MGRSDAGALPAAPDEAALREAALNHLARYATTKAGLCRVLERRIARWARRAAGVLDADEIAAHEAAAKQAVQSVVRQLAASGVVNDQEFAAARARSLLRSGHSRRGIAAHLAARGVGAETLRSVLPDDEEAELAAAVALARRRRIGPFRTGDVPDQQQRQREQAVLARAGFSRAVALKVLAMEHEEAEALVRQMRAPL